MTSFDILFYSVASVLAIIGFILSVIAVNWTYELEKELSSLRNDLNGLREEVKEFINNKK